MKSALHEPGKPRFRVSYGRTGTIATVSAVLCATSLLAIPTAHAAVPTFPNNLVVFPDRDFLTIEGYQDKVGQTATVEVNRPGTGIIGSAKGVIGTGDVAFEINHPGGYCWGEGTGLKVTPDIKPGDVVSIKFDDGTSDSTTVQDAYVTEHSALSGQTLTVRGHVGAGVNKNQMEQRVIEPALKETAVGRRDIRAVPGPLTANEGYSSSLEFSGETFTATYVFTDPAAAEIAAAATGERAMAWEVEDEAANRQGLTIAEFGELGGPGMGGCPNGPLQSGPAGPTDVSVAKVNGDLKINWKPAVAIPGTPAITGYRITAVAQTINGAEQVEHGIRISDPKASSTAIKGIDPNENYDVYAVSVSSAGETFPAIPVIAETDTTAPTVAASPNGGTFPVAQELTLTANELGSDIYYTLDGSDPVSAGVSTEGALLYRGPVKVAESSTFTFAAIDPSGNVSENGTVEFKITNDPVPAAPVIATAPVAGKGTATVSWTAPDPGAEGLTIESYTVQAYTEDGAPYGSGKQVAGDVTSLVYDGLAGDTAYQFTVKATNINGTGAESAKSAVVMVLGDVVANAGPDQSVTRRPTATTVTLDGTGSTAANAAYLWEQVLARPDDPDKVTLSGSDTLKPKFNLAVFQHPMTNNPLKFRLTVTADGVSRTDEVQITPVPDRIAVSLAQWKSRDFRVNGTSTAVGGTVTIRVGNATGAVLGRVTVTAAAAPETGGVFTLRLRDGQAPAANPGVIYVESTLGGTAGPIAVVNK